uniref:Peptidase S1 domain-containing protein n=1 Tax=Panagrolaimus davidi TaxID=227884 RepID=A0A914Q0E0_9BILA
MLCYICAEDVLEKCECGLSSHFFEERSFGSFPHSFPFSGQIRVSFTCNIGNKSEKKVKKCSAIIIDEKFIISAKHYVLYDPTDFGDNCQTTYAEDERNSQIVNGESYHVKTNISFLATSNVTEVNEENLFTIENIFPLTEQYNSLELVMLELSENMTFSMDLRAACIYGGYTPKTGDVLRFAGFGRVVDGKFTLCYK